MTYTKRKALHLRVSEKESLVCTMNESLATTLITNLIKNAYVHNYEKGDIGITISRRMLTIANTGIDKTLDKELLFARFASQSKQQESTGLGLAIVKSIVDLYSIRIRLPIRKWHAYIHIIILLTAEIPNFSKMHPFLCGIIKNKAYEKDQLFTDSLIIIICHACAATIRSRVTPTYCRFPAANSYRII